MTYDTDTSKESNTFGQRVQQWNGDAVAGSGLVVAWRAQGWFVNGYTISDVDKTTGTIRALRSLTLLSLSLSLFLFRADVMSSALVGFALFYQTFICSLFTLHANVNTVQVGPTKTICLWEGGKAGVDGS